MYLQCGNAACAAALSKTGRGRRMMKIGKERLHCWILQLAPKKQLCVNRRATAFPQQRQSSQVTNVCALQHPYRGVLGLFPYQVRRATDGTSALACGTDARVQTHRTVDRFHYVEQR